MNQPMRAYTVQVEVTVVYKVKVHATGPEDAGRQARGVLMNTVEFDPEDENIEISDATGWDILRITP